MDPSFADIIFLALVAGFIVLRLRSSLGKNSGIDPREILRKQQEKLKETVIRVPAREPRPVVIDMTSNVGDGAKSGIEAIKIADMSFTTPGFTDGARVAFEWVFDAFAKGEKDRLKALMSDSVYALFEQEIDRQRQIPDQKPEATLVSILSQDITGATLTGSIARITVRFVSEQIHLVRSAAGAIIEGNPSNAQKVQDTWVFERDLTSRSPNWKIIDT